MTVQLLIDSIVRQITVLIAQLATAGGLRAPLAHIANQVFVELAQELEAQGISRKVSADMFGMALRAYIRKVRRLSEGKTDQGRTLWQAVLEFIREQPVVGRKRVLERFRCDGDVEVSAILHDLLDSGLVFASGTGQQAAYRAATEHEIKQLSRLNAVQGLDELIWATVFRAGPITLKALAEQLSQPEPAISDILERLSDQGRVEQAPDGSYLTHEFLIPPGATAGWEAAVFDHLQAVVQTIGQRLQTDSPDRDLVGGSTYTYDIWPGHPLEDAVRQQLAEMRERCGDLRQRVSNHNAEHGLRAAYDQVTTYVGQCSISRQLKNSEET